MGIIEHILSLNKESSDSPFTVELVEIESILPVTNAWPKQRASAVEGIKSRTRSTMKNDLLNARIYISLNGAPIHIKEEDSSSNKVTDIYVNERHYKVPKLYSEKCVSGGTSVQIDAIEILSDSSYSTWFLD